MRTRDEIIESIKTTIATERQSTEAGGATVSCKLPDGSMKSARFSKEEFDFVRHFPDWGLLSSLLGIVSIHTFSIGKSPFGDHAGQ